MKFDWQQIRSEYEAGSSQSALSKKYNVSRKAIQKHILKETWTQDLGKAINNAVQMKVAGIVTSCDFAKKAEAIDAEAEKRVEIVRNHREEWQSVRQLSREAAKEKNFEKAKLAKITAETIQIIQSGERKAWGLDQLMAVNNTTNTNMPQVTLIIEN
jgi:hypothetical protein